MPGLYRKLLWGLTLAGCATGTSLDQAAIAERAQARQAELKRKSELRKAQKSKLVKAEASAAAAAAKSVDQTVDLKPKVMPHPKDENTGLCNLIEPHRLVAAPNNKLLESDGYVKLPNRSDLEAVSGAIRGELNSRMGFMEVGPDSRGNLESIEATQKFVNAYARDQRSNRQATRIRYFDARMKAEDATSMVDRSRVERRKSQAELAALEVLSSSLERSQAQLKLTISKLLREWNHSEAQGLRYAVVCGWSTESMPSSLTPNQGYEPVRRLVQRRAIKAVGLRTLKSVDEMITSTQRRCVHGSSTRGTMKEQERQLYCKDRVKTSMRSLVVDMLHGEAVPATDLIEVVSSKGPQTYYVLGAFQIQRHNPSTKLANGKTCSGDSSACLEALLSDEDELVQTTRVLTSVDDLDRCGRLSSELASIQRGQEHKRRITHIFRQLAYNEEEDVARRNHRNALATEISKLQTKMRQRNDEYLATQASIHRLKKKITYDLPSKLQLKSQLCRDYEKALADWNSSLHHPSYLVFNSLVDLLPNAGNELPVETYLRSVPRLVEAARTQMQRVAIEESTAFDESDRFEVRTSEGLSVSSLTHFKVVSLAKRRAATGKVYEYAPYIAFHFRLDTSTPDSGAVSPSNTCGNGRVDSGEQCDQGELNGSGECTKQCLVEVSSHCGNRAPVLAGCVDRQLVKPAFFAAKAPWSSWGYESNGSKALVTYQNNWSEHCETDKSSGFLGCVSPYQAAAFCENLDGRLPSINELKDLSSNDNPEWVEQTKDGQDRQFLVRSESGDFVPVGAYQKRSTAGFRCVYEEDSLDK